MFRGRYLKIKDDIMSGKHILSGFILLLSAILIIPSVLGEIDGQVYLVYDNGNQDTISSKIDDGKVSFHFSNEEILISQIKSDGSFIAHPDSFYCWKDCNIFPKIFLEEVRIFENDKPLTNVHIPYSNAINEDQNPKSVLLSVFKDNKVKNDQPLFKTNNIDNFDVPILSQNIDNFVYSVKWKGVLIVPESKDYFFFLNVSNMGKVWVDNEIVYSQYGPISNDSYLNKKSLKEGKHNLTIEYITTSNYHPNIFWGVDRNTLEVISNSYLLFESGGSKKINHNESLSITRSTLQDVGLSNIYPTYAIWGYNTIDTSKRPILLIHGWSNKDLGQDQTNMDSQWGNVPLALENKGHEVLELVYNPAKLDNRKNAGMFSTITQIIRNNYPNFNQMDVVSHSMGGMVVRGYIQNLGISQSGNPRSYQNDIRKYVIIASPMHGTYLANLINNNYNFPSSCDVIDYFLNLNEISEATLNMEQGSDYIWDLNSQTLNKNINYFTIAGFKQFPTCFFNNLEPTDGLVGVTSSNLLKNNVPHVLVKQFHSDIHKSDQTVNIISAFINGNLNLIKSYLNNGEYYINPNDPNSDYNPFTKGEVLIQFKNINPTNVVLKNDYETYTLVKNTRTGRWFYLNFQDFNNFQTRMFIGSYDVYYNRGNGLIDSGVDLVIDKGATTLKLIADSDSDGLLDEFDVCSNQFGTYCHGCPQPACNICNQASCPSIGAPTCVNSPSTTQCGTDFSEYGCPWGMNYSSDTGVRFHDLHCNGFGTCIDDSQNWIVDEECSISQSCFWDELGQGDINFICKCKPSWILNQSWSSCINGHQSRNYYDINNCNVSDSKPNNKFINCSFIETISPKNGNYEERSLPFIINLLEEVQTLEYSDNNARYSRLCSKCQFFNKSKNFDDGYHNLSIKATDYNSKVYLQNVSFFIDSIAPRVLKQEPGNNDLSNGHFKVKYTEDNVQSIALHFGNHLIAKSDCPSGRNVECDFYVNVSEYDGETIPYWFEVSDLFNTASYRRQFNVLIDTSLPILTIYHPLNRTIYPRRVPFNITINENNPDSLLYIDYSDRRPQNKTLCRECNDYGFTRPKTKLFSEGNHTIEFIALDKVGNINKQIVTFEVNVSN